VHQFGFLHDGEGPRGFGERHTLDILHHEMGYLFGLTEVVDADDVRVADSCQCAGFLHEAGAHLGIALETRAQDFDRHPAAQAFVHGQEHAAHSSRSYHPEDPVTRELFRQVFDRDRRRRLVRTAEEPVYLCNRAELQAEFRLQFRMQPAEAIRIDVLFACLKVDIFRHSVRYRLFARVFRSFVV
jgi:hypothetical protein